GGVGGRCDPARPERDAAGQTGDVSQRFEGVEGRRVIGTRRFAPGWREWAQKAIEHPDRIQADLFSAPRKARDVLRGSQGPGVWQADPQLELFHAAMMHEIAISL